MAYGGLYNTIGFLAPRRWRLVLALGLLSQAFTILMLLLPVRNAMRQVDRSADGA